MAATLAEEAEAAGRAVEAVTQRAWQLQGAIEQLYVTLEEPVLEVVPGVAKPDRAGEV